MLLLAIVSTAILGIYIVLLFDKYDDDEDVTLIVGNAFVMLSFIFIIITIWALYRR